MRCTFLHIAGVLGCLIGAASPAGAAEVAEAAFKGAVAVWHFRDLNDSAGANSVLKPFGQARVGVALAGEDHKASLARGGDGFAAELKGGAFNAAQGAAGELNLTGRAMSMLIRLRDPSGKWGRSLLSKYGGHDRLTCNLFSHDFGGGAAGMSIGFEIGIKGRAGLGGQVKAPIGAIGPTRWHDVIVRYDGKAVELYIDGARADRKPVSGALRQGNTEPLIVGGHSTGGRILSPFRGQIDHAALWSRALTDAEIVALSGGRAEVGKTKAAIDKRRAAMGAKKWAGLPKEVAAFRKVVKSKDVETFGAAALALRRWMIANDPHLPVYHFTGPESWINDANGVIYHKGTYHLFYQFDPIVDGRRSRRCWGHAVSSDLVHWRDWPVAIWPDSKYDRGGVYSGNVVIDDKGFPVALYTGNVAGHRETYGMLARSTDGFVTWQKKMVMDNKQRPNARSPVHWDAQIWKDGDTWYQLIGGSTGGKSAKGAAFLWTSGDLERWTLAKPIYTGGPGRFWELPYLLGFGRKYVLMIGVGGNPYWVGTYDKKTLTFKPDNPRTRSADPGDYYAVNPHMVDDKGPGGSQRRIMHAWARTPPTPTKSVPWWQGAHAIPRVISVAGGRLVQEPIPELKVLRGKKSQFGNLSVTPESKDLLEGAGGDALEIIATFKPGGAKRFGLKVRASADGKGGVIIWYDPAGRQFGVANRRAPSDLKAPGPVRLHVFVDRSIVEAYCNGNAITKVTYVDAAAKGLAVFAEGGKCTLESIEIWKMKSMWE